MKKIVSKLINKYSKLNIVLKATIWFTFCSVLQKGISMITTPIFTRLLSTEEYGLYSSYLSWLNIFTVLITLKLEAGVFNKGMSKFKDDRDGYTTAMQGLTTVLTTIALAIYLIFHSFINELTELPTIIILLMFLEIYFVPAYNFWIRRNRYDYKYKSVVLVTIALTIANTLFGILAVLLLNINRGVSRIISIALVQCMFGFCIYIVNLTKCKKLYNPKYWKFALKFNLPLLPHYFSIYILQHSDRVMIQKLCNYTKVAMYSVVYNFSMVLNVLLDSLNNAIIPWIYDNLERKNFRNIKDKVQLLSIFLMAMLILFMLLAPEVIRVLAPASYYEAIYVVPPVTGSLLYMFMYVLIGNVEFYYDCNKATMFVSLIGAIMNIILNLVFIPLFGYIAAGYTTLVCYILFAFSHLIYSNSIAKKKDNIMIFDIKFYILETIVLIAFIILISMFYNYIYVRISIIVIILTIMIINRKKIIEWLNSMIKKEKTK